MGAGATGGRRHTKHTHPLHQRQGCRNDHRAKQERDQEEPRHAVRGHRRADLEGDDARLAGEELELLDGQAQRHEQPGPAEDEHVPRPAARQVALEGREHVPEGKGGLVSRSRGE